MKKVILNITAFFVLIVFMTFSTGIIVTIHECCSKHHHETTEHNHCHDSTRLLKIDENADAFVFSVKTFSKVFYAIVEIISPDMTLETLTHIILKENRKLPPSVTGGGKEICQFLQQWVYYA